MSNKPTNKLISIGYLGFMQAYLNVSREEAIRRYRETEDIDEDQIINDSHEAPQRAYGTSGSGSSQKQSSSPTS